MPNWKMDPGELLKFTFEGSDYMAIPTSIKTLLSGDVVEWARIEFKETWDAAASLKSICAFANDLDNWGGGYIVIGVQEDNGRPVFPLKGVQKDKLDSYQKNIFAKCKLLRPAYTPIMKAWLPSTIIPCATLILHIYVIRLPKTFRRKICLMVPYLKTLHWAA